MGATTCVRPAIDTGAAGVMGPRPVLTVPRETVQEVFSAVLLAASLFVILSKRFAPKEKHWAYGTIGTLVGFWFRP